MIAIIRYYPVDSAAREMQYREEHIVTAVSPENLGDGTKSNMNESTSSAHAIKTLLVRFKRVTAVSRVLGSAADKSVIAGRRRPRSLPTRPVRE